MLSLSTPIPQANGSQGRQVDNCLAPILKKSPIFRKLYDKIKLDKARVA